jgi:hypothetical protein
MLIARFFTTIFLVLLVGCATKPAVPADSGQTEQNGGMTYLEIGEWRLNDSRETIRSLNSLPNLREVSVTSGLETPDATFDGKKKNISFVFDQNGLAYSQVWLYEGKSLDEAAEEFSKLHMYFQDHLGGATLKGLSAEGGMTPELVKVGTNQIYNNVSRGIKETNDESEEKVTFLLTLDMSPISQPKNNRLHGVLIYSGQHDQFYVFLYEDRVNSPERGAENHVELFQAGS